ncbi:hypothetical protein D3C87_1407440 [compost metagenome]
MPVHFKKNAKVEWTYLGRVIQGTVEDVFHESVTKTIKDKKITRHGSKEKPAYLVKSEAGNIALKLESEIRSQKKAKASAPKMFSKDSE